MRVLLLACLLPLGAGVMPAQAQPVMCPGNNTVEMRYCASKDLEQSNSALRRKISAPLFQQWQSATRAVCAKAYAPYRDGTIYPPAGGELRRPAQPRPPQAIPAAGELSN